MVSRSPTASAPVHGSAIADAPDTLRALRRRYGIETGPSSAARRGIVGLRFEMRARMAAYTGSAASMHRVRPRGCGRLASAQLGRANDLADAAALLRSRCRWCWTQAYRPLHGPNAAAFNRFASARRQRVWASDDWGRNEPDMRMRGISTTPDRGRAWNVSCGVDCPIGHEPAGCRSELDLRTKGACPAQRARISSTIQPTSTGFERTAHEGSRNDRTLPHRRRSLATRTDPTTQVNSKDAIREEIIKFSSARARPSPRHVLTGDARIFGGGGSGGAPRCCRRRAAISAHNRRCAAFDA